MKYKVDPKQQPAFTTIVTVNGYEVKISKFRYWNDTFKIWYKSELVDTVDGWFAFGYGPTEDQATIELFRLIYERGLPVPLPYGIKLPK